MQTLSASRSALSLSLCDLPDDLLAACLAPLDVKERLTRVCFVSKRLHALCLRPQLLCNLSVRIYQWEEDSHELPSLGSLAAWLSSLGCHVRSLEFEVLTCMSYSSQEHQWLFVALCNCLEACSQLEQLRFVVPDANFPNGLPLATSLTSLELQAVNDSQLLPQYPLPHLRRARLRAVWSSEDARRLAALQGLTHLQLLESPLPAGLLRLSELRHLCLVAPDGGFSEEEQQHFAAALASTQQLTHLTVEIFTGRALLRLPAELAGLARLQTFRYYGGPDAQPAAHLALPLGAWAGSLQHIATHWRLLAASIGLLHACTRLSEVVAIGEADFIASPRWSAFWLWAEQHPPLQRLVLKEEEWDLEGSWDGYSLAKAMANLWRVRPGLEFSVAKFSSLFDSDDDDDDGT